MDKNYELNVEARATVGAPFVRVTRFERKYVERPDLLGYVQRDTRFTKELIYGGRSRETINVSYREFSEGYARPAFSQQLTYQLDRSDVIAFREFRIRVLHADNETIAYTVLADGSSSATGARSEPDGVVIQIREGGPGPVNAVARVHECIYWRNAGQYPVRIYIGDRSARRLGLCRLTNWTTVGGGPALRSADLAPGMMAGACLASGAAFEYSASIREIGVVSTGSVLVEPGGPSDSPCD